MRYISLRIDGAGPVKQRAALEEARRRAWGILRLAYDRGQEEAYHHAEGVDHHDQDRDRSPVVAAGIHQVEVLGQRNPDQLLGVDILEVDALLEY